jgi:UDP-glucose 4-epimerase
MRYLITGGAGFVGSHLAEWLLNDGHSVVVIDDLSTGSIRNIQHLKGRSGFEYVIESMFSRSLLAELIDDCDLVFHLGAAVGVRLIVESPVRTIETNVRGSETVLELASKKKKKVVVASTSEVYGKSNKIPFSEDDDLVMGPTVKGRWSYACSKAVDEFLALAYWREFKLPTVVVRLFNTIGPRQSGHYGMVVPRFIGQAFRGENLTVYGTGKQSRCFTYVSDVVEWLVRLASSHEANGQVFNLGNPEEITIADLASKIIDLTGANVGIDYIPYEKAYEEGFEDMMRRVPDIRKVEAATAYSPRIGLDQALRLTRDWFIKEFTSPQVASIRYGRVAGANPYAYGHHVKYGS